MAATATQYGTGAWGISGVEMAGIIMESVSFNFSQSEKTIKNRTGNTTGVTYYDEQVKGSIKGVLPSSSKISTTLAASLLLSPAISSYNFLKGGVSTGLNLVTGITVDLNQEDYEKISIDFVNYPNITA